MDFEKDVLKKFDTVIKLLTISSLKGEKQLEKIRILNGAGLPPKEIAELLGTSANSVSVALNKLKKKSIIVNQDLSEDNTNGKEESSGQ